MKLQNRRFIVSRVYAVSVPYTRMLRQYHMKLMRRLVRLWVLSSAFFNGYYMTKSTSARPTRPAHDGQIEHTKSFDEVLLVLSNEGPLALHTRAGTPFEAHYHIMQRGERVGQRCIRITRDGAQRAYIYECCWGHVTNCSRTYIDVYSSALWGVSI